MKLGLNIGYTGAQVDMPVKRILRAEELGFDTLWTSEAYGTDALTPLAYGAARAIHSPPGRAYLSNEVMTPELEKLLMLSGGLLGGASGRGLLQR